MQDTGEPGALEELQLVPSEQVRGCWLRWCSGKEMEEVGTGSMTFFVPAFLPRPAVNFQHHTLM